jgi:hypothetical protein
MASHTKDELREAARILGKAALAAGWRPSAGVPIAEAQSRGSHADAGAAADAGPAPRAGVFDQQADSVARAA